jgi:hypothetical protein
MDPKWLDILGLVIAMSGAIVLACALIISRKQALRIGVSCLAENTDDVNLPLVRNKLRESRFALIGLILLILGFLLQIAANWPTHDRVGNTTVTVLKKV